jgi:DNA-binding Lrp family transcriptional regulator
MTDPTKGESPMASLSEALERPHARVPVDELDLRILRLLDANSRLSQRRIAQEIDMSAPAVGERIARLERSGVIRSYTVDVDWAALGFPLVVFMPITLLAGADVGDILTTLRALPELEELIVVTGGYDLLARFRLRGHDHLRELLIDPIWQIRGIQRIETFLSIGELVGPTNRSRLLDEPPEPRQ